MKKMRTFDIGNRKAKLFELFLKANKYVYVATFSYIENVLEALVKEDKK